MFSVSKDIQDLLWQPAQGFTDTNPSFWLLLNHSISICLVEIHTAN